MLALQVELCSPRSIASRVEARWQPSGFWPGLWPQGQSNESTHLSCPPRRRAQSGAVAGAWRKIPLVIDGSVESEQRVSALDLAPDRLAECVL